ncbi:MAG TPA: hypothetical protein VJ044_18695, partial [Candidatus Hodarchaeales archaeon]|nr:hypothetical protein [Candidatus Hodarchaeales archaeon]
VWNGEQSKYEMPDGVILEHVPITKQLIDLKARVYLEQPERKVTGKKAPTGSNGQDKKPVKAEKYTDLLKRSGWFSTSKRIEQYTQLLGDMACGVFLDEQAKLLQFLPILEYYPVFAEDDEIQINPIGIFYPSALRTTSGEQIWIYYDAEKKVKYSNGGNKIGEEPNNYGVFNFFFPCREKPVNSYLIPPRVPLILANQAIDVAMVSLNESMKRNGFKFLWGVGKDLKALTQLTLGKSRALMIDPSTAGDSPPSLNVLDMQVDFLQHVNAIKFKMESISQLMNMMVQWEMGGTPQSGVAFRIQNVRDLDDRVSQTESVDEMTEQPLWKIVSAISKNFNLDVESGELIVDFPEPKMETNVNDDIAREKHEIEIGKKNVIDFIMQDNPDLSQDEAEKMLAINLKMKKLVMNPPTADTLSLEKMISDILEEKDVKLEEPPMEPTEKPTMEGVMQ